MSGRALHGSDGTGPVLGRIVQAAPHIGTGTGVAAVAESLERQFDRLGVPTDRFTLDQAHGGWLPHPGGRIGRTLVTVAEVVWFSTVGTAILRRRASGTTVVICHNDALAGDIYVNHGLLKASLRARGGLWWRVLRNPIHLFILMRDGWRYRSRIHRRIVVLGQAEERLLRQTYPRLRIPVAVIPNGVDTAHFRPARPDDADRSAVRRAWGLAEHDVAVLFVGHEFDRKGLAVILEALPALPPVVRLIVVGGTAQLVELAQRQATRLGVGNRVVFAGEAADTAPSFRAADVFCLPSAYESYGLVFVEALASGLPVVATRVGVAPELIVDGVNGMLADRTGAAVAAAISAILERPDVPWSQSARATALRSSWESAAARYLELAREVLAERRTA